MSTNLRKRRTEERTEITRNKLLDAATRLFSEQGFDGISIRDLEKAADVQGGLLAYHFGDKETLWKTAADRTFGIMSEQVNARTDILKDLSKYERIATMIRFYVRFSASHPEFSRLLSQEGRQDSWRIRYLIEHHLRPSTEDLQLLIKEAKGIEGTAFINWYYIMISASSTIFSFAPECLLLFGVDSREESMVEAHADMLVAMLLGVGG